MPVYQVEISVSTTVEVEGDDEEFLEGYLYDEAPDIMAHRARRGDYTYRILNQTP